MSTPFRRLLVLCLAVALLPHLTPGWETGVEYVYEYDGQLAVGLRESHERQSAVVRFHAQLTAQSIDDNTLTIKLSEIRIKRHGSAPFGGSASGEQIWLPIETADGEEEAVGDALHLLSPFVVVHNKGSFVNLMVESEDPAWSVNVKKAAASVLQLDVTGVRSGLDGGVFGERSSTLNSLEDGVTGDCLTTLRFTRLPYHRSIRQRSDQVDRVVADLCRSSNVYEIVKIKDFDECRVDPVQSSASPAAIPFTFSSSGEPSRQVKRSAAYKYLACGESSERATIVQIDGSAVMASPGPAGAVNQQTVRLALKSRAQIHQLLPNVTRPKVLDTLVYSTPPPPPPPPPDDSPTDPGASTSRIDSAGYGDLKEHVKTALGILRDVAERLVESAKSDADLVDRLAAVASTLARLDAAQLSTIWQGSMDSSARDLFLDCAAASGTHPAANFLLDLIEFGQVRDIQASSLLASVGHSIQLPNTGLLQRFVRIAKTAPSRSFKATALAVAAELLHANCIVAQLTCRSDAQVVTEDFLPFVVSELENARSSGERLAILTALGALGSDDVLLLLVPYIRGDDVSTRIAAIRSLRRLMDSYPEKVVPLLSSLADNVAERPEVRMAAVDVLLFHADTPLKIWRKIAHRTWFEPVQQVNSYVYTVIRSLASSRVAALASPSGKARQVLPLTRPSAERGGFHFNAAFKSDDHGVFSKMAAWRVGNNPLPAFVDFEFFYQLGNVAFDPVQLSIWNYNMETFWNKLLGRLPSESHGAKLREIWDQISLRYRPEDDRIGLVYVKLMGSTLQGFFQLEEDARLVERAWCPTDACRVDVRLVKFQQLAEFRTSVPTELGFPARFKLSVAGLVSARGSAGGRSADVATLLACKWSSEARVALPFSAHYASAGVDLRAELRAPRHVALVDASLAWKLPERDTDLAYFHVVPFTLTRSARDDLATPATEAQQLRVVSVRDASNFTQRLGANLRFEVASETASDASASVWLRRLVDADYSAFSLERLERRVYRLRYLPDAPFDSLAVSIETLHSHHRRRDVGVVSGSSDDDDDDDAPADLHLVKSRITARYLNGTTSQWTPVELEIERGNDDADAVYSVNVIGSPSGFIQSYLDGAESLNGKSNASLGRNNVTVGSLSIQLEQYGVVGSLLQEGLLSAKKRSSCLIETDRVTTYDGVEYDYKLNECHHILTADCSRRGTRYAITGRSDPVHGLLARVTLENDVIDLSNGNISFNGAIVESNATSNMRLRSGENVTVALFRSDDDTIRLVLLREEIHVVINQSRITIHAGNELLGRACGVCGDGDGEASGEFKTPDRCAVSSGSLMASSFQISNEHDECPLLSDDAFQHLQRESYPCYSVDEQVPSILPLPPES